MAKLVRLRVILGGALALLTVACGQVTTTPMLSTPTPYTPRSTSVITAQPTSSALATAPAAAMKIYQASDVPFTFSYPQDWMLNQDSATGVSIGSPESMKNIRAPQLLGDACVNCQPEISINYFATITEEPSNKLGRLGAVNVTDLLKKDANLKLVGTTMVDGKPAFQVLQYGVGTVYAIYVELGKGIYEITFNQRYSDQEITATERAILNSLHFITPTSAAQNSVGVGASLQSIR